MTPLKLGILLHYATFPTVDAPDVLREYPIRDDVVESLLLQ